MNVSTVERLAEYGEFDANIVEAVVRIEDEIRDKSYKDFLADNNIPEPRYYATGKDNYFQYVDLRPETDNDDTPVNVLHLTMGSGVTPNKLVRGAAFFLANPTERLIITGGPGLLLKDYGGKLGYHERKDVDLGLLRPVVEPMFDYLRKEGVSKTRQLGASRGADVAAAAGMYAFVYDHEVDRSVYVEPVSVAKRGLLGVAKAYKETEKGYKATLEETDFPLLAESRELSENDLTYTLALLRLTNLAMTRYLGQVRFHNTAEYALSNNPEMHTTISWGDKSEIARPVYLQAVVQQLQRKFKQRVSALPTHSRHGSLDDIAFHSAVMLQGLQPAA